MIIVGNPETLQLDSSWFEMVKYCKEVGAVSGDPFILKSPNHTPSNYKDNLLANLTEKLSKVEIYLAGSEEIESNDSIDSGRPKSTDSNK